MRRPGWYAYQGWAHVPATPVGRDGGDALMRLRATGQVVRVADYEVIRVMRSGVVRTGITGARQGTRSKIWITAYGVTRHYGGHEEGGWWYNWYEPLESQYVPAHAVDARREKLRRKWTRREAFGNIYSMQGGCEIAVHAEGRPGEDATTRRPHYE